MTTKVCFKCLVPKDLSEFYRHRCMADGYIGKCKECARADSIANRKAKLEYYLRYDRARATKPESVAARAKYRATPKGKAAHDRGQVNWVARNPHKRAAHHAVNNALRDGILTKLPCEKCGTTVDIEGHHDDYSKPLEVRWLCRTHHAEHHRNERNLPKVPDKALLHLPHHSVAH